ncbi:transcriptional regulator [Kribbella sp. NPDC023972]|uniref:transcriptional regulator n=1 Tax=Kribbella sp. NPDC023972 TaxID=3154795 RepID=UPI0033E49197
MTHASTADLLVLHAVRLLGVADDDAVARRFALDPAVAKELLLDDQAFGWITWNEFAGIGGWSLTARGREENERRLAAELELVEGAHAVREVYRAFLPLNERLQIACTQWQLRPTDADPHAFNDHSDPAWDRRVVAELSALADHLGPLSEDLAAVLDRFRGYRPRFTAALDHVLAGDHAWVDRTDVDSCHRVWFELHEDLIATLGLPRGVEPA